MSDIAKIEAGANRTYGITKVGELYAWGRNQYGELGIGNENNQSIPQRVNGLYDVAMVSAGSSHSVAVLKNGDIYSFGNNLNGQLGIGNTKNFNTPQKIDGLNNVRVVIAGDDYSIVTLRNSEVYAWGKVNTFYGNNILNTGVDYVQKINDLTDIVKVSTKNTFNVALTQNGEVYTWGSNDYGQLGVGDYKESIIPHKVNGLSDIIDIDAGSEHCIALTSSGDVYAWGRNTYGQLGVGDNLNKSIPQKVDSITNIKKISAGGGQSFAIKENGQVYAWGQNDFGQLGIGGILNQSTPHNIIGLNDVVSIMSRYTHSLAVTVSGEVYAWGNNSNGQLGLGNVISSETPKKINTLSNAVQIDVGYYHSLAVTESGEVYSWGSNSDGQLGLGNKIDYDTPQKINNFDNISKIKAGDYHSIAIKKDGKVYTWGNNGNGQLGLGNKIDYDTPQKINNFDNVSDVSASKSYSLSIQNGSIYGWGENSNYYIGRLVNRPETQNIRCSSKGDDYSIMIDAKEILNPDKTKSLNIEAYSPYGIKSIKLPDCRYITGHSIVYKTDSEGEYEFVVEDNNGKIKTEIVEVTNLYEEGVNHYLTPYDWTNKDVVNITVTARDDDNGIKRIKLPDGTYVNSDLASYDVTENGTFLFEIESNGSNIILHEVNVDNIDRDKPNKPTISQEGSLVKITENDDVTTTTTEVDYLFKIEDFEDGDYDYSFTYSGGNWGNSNIFNNGGEYSFKSATINKNQVTSAEFAVSIPEGSPDNNFSFDYKVDSEINDKFYAYLDGNVVINGDSGTANTWKTFNYNLIPGSHTIKFEYKKDNKNTTSGNDAVFIDNLALIEKIESDIQNPKSGVKEILYKIEGQEWQKYIAPFVSTKNIEAKVIDNAGNESDVESFEVLNSISISLNTSSINFGDVTSASQEIEKEVKATIASTFPYDIECSASNLSYELNSIAFDSLSLSVDGSEYVQLSDKNNKIVENISSTVEKQYDFRYKLNINENIKAGLYRGIVNIIINVD